MLSININLRQQKQTYSLEKSFQPSPLPLFNLEPSEESFALKSLSWFPLGAVHLPNSSEELWIWRALSILQRQKEEEEEDQFVMIE